jgi:hypothetical protein
MTDEKVPSYADLQAGISGKDLLDAINRSGYPFQAEIADHVRTKLSETEGSEVQEEWAYIDSDAGGVRSLDVFVEAPLHSTDDVLKRKKKIRPYLNVLIECKQSELPYIFFLRANSAGYLNFPEIAGMPSADLRIFMEPQSSPLKIPFNMSLHDVFACFNLRTFLGPPFNAISAAKAARKGNKLELSGEEIYRGLTLPLMKAADYIRADSAREPDAEVLSPKFIASLAVIRAPLIGAYLHQGKIVMLGIPWVRTCRVEPANADQRTQPTGNVRYFDVVHSDFFPDYIEALIKDSFRLAERMLMCDEVVHAGVGLRTYEVQPEGSRGSETYKYLKELPDEYADWLEAPSPGRISWSPGEMGFEWDPEFQDPEEGIILHVEPPTMTPEE